MTELRLLLGHLRELIEYKVRMDSRHQSVDAQYPYHLSIDTDDISPLG